MKNKFTIGQRIICVNGSNFPIFTRQAVLPVKYNIYTVRDFCPNYPEAAILLKEVVNGPIARFVNGNIGEPSWVIKRFRPLFDISELEKLLKQEPVDA